MGGEEGGASGLNRCPRCPTSMSFVSGTTLQSFRRGKSSKCGKGGIVNKLEKGKEAGREGGRKEGEKREGVKQEERARKKNVFIYSVNLSYSTVFSPLPRERSHS